MNKINTIMIIPQKWLKNVSVNRMWIQIYYLPQLIDSSAPWKPQHNQYIPAQTQTHQRLSLLQLVLRCVFPLWAHRNGDRWQIPRLQQQPGLLLSAKSEQQKNCFVHVNLSYIWRNNILSQNCMGFTKFTLRFHISSTLMHYSMLMNPIRSQRNTF